MSGAPLPPLPETHVHFSASVVAVVVFLVLAAVGAALWSLERQKRLEVERASEERHLRDQGLLVAAQVTREELDAQVRGLQAGFQQLQATLADVRAKAPATRVVEVTHIVTKTVAVPGPTGTCLLAPGDPAHIEVGEVRLKTKLGNEVLTGVAAAYRADVKLFESPFESVASRTAREREPVQDTIGWGFGPHVQMNHGVGVGVVVGTPMASVFGFKLEATGALAVGSNGISGALNALIRR